MLPYIQSGKATNTKTVNNTSITSHLLNLVFEMRKLCSLNSEPNT